MRICSHFFLTLEAPPVKEAQRFLEGICEFVSPLIGTDIAHPYQALEHCKIDFGGSHGRQIFRAFQKGKAGPVGDSQPD